MFLEIFIIDEIVSFIWIIYYNITLHGNMFAEILIFTGILMFFGLFLFAGTLLVEGGDKILLNPGSDHVWSTLWTLQFHLMVMCSPRHGYG